ncbi:unnamed protein product [Rotaria socialis]|uniref:Coiled-coil domain-containing protein 6 n=1 Tax=Rotaria socialis TaxID=392032 RepID=A0A818ZGX8_9BILA|nr:unnamed protein product [Rotaria socialis]CAF4580304.1 unnamed protein product [Rotaria socialis]
MQTDSECESDVSSIAGCATTNQNESKLSCEHLIKRIDSLAQENRVLQIEAQTYKLRLKASQQEIKQLKHSSVNIQVKTEQEEEFISNTLFKKIKELKKEKETLANNYEREEEFLTNDLSKRLLKIREEKFYLEKSLEQEQAAQINQLIKRIQRLEAEITNKQITLEQLKNEKIELENILGKEQEYLVNNLWKRMKKLEKDKKLLQLKIQQPQSHSYNTKSDPSSSTDLTIDERLNIRCNSLLESNLICNNFSSNNNYARQLKHEAEKLRQELNAQQEMHKKRIEELMLDEQNAKNENLRLRRKLQIEVDRREQLYKQLSESESSLEMNEERALNRNIRFYSKKEKPTTSALLSSSQYNLARSRTSSSPAFIINQNIEHLQRRLQTSNSLDTNNNNMD